MSRYARLSVLWLSLSVPAMAQLALDSEWTAFTSMTQTNDVIVIDNDVWVASSGGALHYDRVTREYRRFTQLDGLAGNQVLSVTMDASRNLWFGTASQGLSRLRDGAARFDPPFLEFRDLDILSLLAYEDRLYVGTERGLSVFLLDKEEVKESYRRLGNLPKDAPVNAVVIHDGILYAGTGDGIAWANLNQPNLQDPDSWRSVTRPGNIRDMVVADDLVMAASLFGIFTYAPTIDGFFLDYDDEPVVALGSLNNSGLAATQGGNFMRRLSPSVWRRLGAPLITGVTGVSELNDGSVWLSTNTGLRVVGAEAPPPSGEPGSSRFYNLIVADDELWAASVPDDQQRALSAGVYQLADGAWTVYSKSTGMPNNELVALETDRDGHLWVGSWGGGIAVRLGDRWLELDEQNSVLGGIGRNQDFVAIGDISRDSDGNMWVVNVAVGVAVIDAYPQGQGFLFDQTELGLAARLDLYRIALAAQGHVWLASRTDGLVILDHGGTPFKGGDDHFTVVNQASEARLSSNRAFDLIEDDEGTLWLATDNGLNAIRGNYDRAAARFDVDSWRVYTSFDGLPTNEINVLELDDQGHLWIGTNSGLSRIDDGEVAFTLTTTNSGLINNRVTGLFFDAASNEMWIGTLDGLSRLRLGTVTGAKDDPISGRLVYPNPFVTDGRELLNFAGLPLGARVRIFTPRGELVTSLATDPGRGSVSWSGQNEAGFLVASGIYFYVVEAGTGTPIRGRFAVVNGVGP